MVNLDEIVARAKKIRGLSQDRDIASIFGISASDFSNRKKRGTLFPLLLEWAINENVNLHWFVTGEEPSQGKPASFGDFTYLPLVGAQLSCGNGSFVISEEIKKYVAFRTDWLLNTLGPPQGKYIMGVIGDSMAPTIQNGDTVMLDTGRRHVYDGNIYALRMNDTIMVKRLALRPGDSVQVISDNKVEYEPYEAHRKDIHVIGRVVWFARTLVKPNGTDLPKTEHS